MKDDLHKRLIERQTDDELRRKAFKAEGRYSRQFFIQETVDFVERRAERWKAALAAAEGRE